MIWFLPKPRGSEGKCSKLLKAHQCLNQSITFTEMKNYISFNSIFYPSTSQSEGWKLHSRLCYLVLSCDPIQEKQMSRGNAVWNALGRMRTNETVMGILRSLSHHRSPAELKKHPRREGHIPQVKGSFSDFCPPYLLLLMFICLPFYSLSANLSFRVGGCAYLIHVISHPV